MSSDRVLILKLTAECGPFTRIRGFPGEMGEYWSPCDTGTRERILLKVGGSTGLGSRIGFSRMTGGKDLKPARGNDADAERQVTGVDQVDNHGAFPMDQERLGSRGAFAWANQLQLLPRLIGTPRQLKSSSD